MDFVTRTILGDLPLTVLLTSSSSPTAAWTTTIEEKDVEDRRVCLIEFQKMKKKQQRKQKQKHQQQQNKQRSLATGVFSFSNHRDSVLLYDNCSIHNKMISRDDYCYDDDDTASTVDMEDDDTDEEEEIDEVEGLTLLSLSSSSLSSCSSSSSSSSTSCCSSSRKRVTFPTNDEDLVTAVHTRPRTTKSDKYYLHYDEYDYMDFKLEYRDDLYRELYNKERPSSRSLKGGKPLYYRKSGSRKVSFKLDVIDSVHPVMDLNARKELQNDLFYTANEMRDFLDDFVASLQRKPLTPSPAQTTTLASAATATEDEDDDDTNGKEPHQEAAAVAATE